MNRKYFITFLVFLFLIPIHVNGTCNPFSCAPCADICDGGGLAQGCTGNISYANLLSNSTLSITVSGETPPQGFGHFTMKIDNGSSYRWLKKPIWVNGADCFEGSSKAQNPFTSTWPFNFPTPQEGHGLIFGLQYIGLVYQKI